jgi:PAS domain S-box-containing protein
MSKLAGFVSNQHSYWRVDELLGQYIADLQSPRPEEVQRLAEELQSRQNELTEQNRQLQEAQQQLEAYRDRYIDLYDFAPVGYVTLDEEGYVQEINLAGARIFGREPSELVGFPLADRVATQDRAVFLEHVRRCCKERIAVTSALSLVAGDDRCLAVQLHSVPVADLEQDLTFCKTAITDITERKQIEDGVRENEARFHSIFHDAAVGMAVVSPEGQLMQVNRAMCGFLGYEEAELVGKTVQAITHPEDWEMTARRIREALSGGPPIQWLEKRYLHRTGQVLWGEANASVVRDAHGEPSCLVTQVLDITARKRVEQRVLQVNSWKEQLLGPKSLRQKLQIITDGVVDVLRADFARIWAIKESDLCEQGCRYASITAGPDVCLDRNHCLHLVASSGRYRGVEGSHRRVPLSCYKIGRVASGADVKFVTNDVTHDPGVHDHQWAEGLGLVSFAGYRLLSPEGKPLGVLAMFSRRAIDAGDEALLQDLANTASQIIRAGMAEEALQQAHDELEEKVQQRTATLAETVQALLKEIGDHRWARQALQDARDQLRYLLSESPAVIYSARPCEDYGRTFVSDTITSQLGYEPHEFTDDAVFWLRHIHPDDVAQIVAALPVLFEHDRHVLEYRFRHRDGKYRWVHDEMKLIRDRKRQPLEIVGYWADITERKRTEEALCTSEHRYRQLLDAVTTYTYSVAFLNGRPATTQHTAGCLRATGYGAEEFAADPYLWFRMIHPDDRELVQQYVARILEGETTPPIEHRILHKDGGVHWLRNTIIQRRNEADLLVGYDGLVEDVSERKQAEEALRERVSQLVAAEAIQARLWPKDSPALPGFDIAGTAYSAEFADGDYFDYVPMTDGSLGLVVGDVSGHGLGPAIVMALTYAHLRSLAQVYNGIDDILTRLNQFLVNETDHFVTLLFGRLIPDTRSFEAINAGHPPGYVLDSSGQVKGQIESTTVPLAVVPDAKFQYCDSITLDTNDIVLLYTDGIIEARSPEGVMFGQQRMLEVVGTHRDRPAADILKALHGAVQDFCRPGKPQDDVTAIVIKVGPEAEFLAQG